MNSLSKDQKDELATSMAVLALYDGGVSFHAMTLSAHDPFQSSLAIWTQPGMSPTRKHAWRISYFTSVSYALSNKLMALNRGGAWFGIHKDETKHICKSGLTFCSSLPHPFFQAEISSEQIKVLLEATGNTKVEAFYPIIFANFLSNPEKVAELISNPGGSGGGGGDGAAAGDGAAEVIEEEEPEEEEAGPGDAVDMFGGDDAGGDY